MLRLLSISALLLLLPPGHALATDMTGSWEHRGPAESSKWLVTKQQGERVVFQLELQRGAPSYNSGWIEGEIELRQNTGVFRKATDGGLCEIGFEFHPGRVELRQLGDAFGCGFGYNVFADGVLRRKSRAIPRFSDGDPRSGQ